MDAEALRLVERAIARHGGERWSRIEAVELPVLALSGFLPWLKGYPRSFGLPRLVRVDPVGVRGVFDRGRVALGEAEPVEHRPSFSGAGKRRRWSALDALYFFGYALTHYHSL